jgi:hypothetical protein
MKVYLNEQQCSQLEQNYRMGTQFSVRADRLLASRDLVYDKNTYQLIQPFRGEFITLTPVGYGWYEINKSIKAVELQMLLEWDGEGDEHRWNDLTEELTRLMEGRENWHCKVANFGWQKSSGETELKADTGRELLRKVLPDADNHFRIYKDSHKIVIQNAHHDSPMGDETYTLTEIQ